MDLKAQVVLPTYLLYTHTHLINFEIIHNVNVDRMFYKQKCV